MQTLNMTQLAMLTGVFAVVFLVALASMHALSTKERRRIEQVGATRFDSSKTSPDAGQPEVEESSKWLETIVEISQPISKLSIPKEGWEGSVARLKLVNAGWRTPNAVAVFFAAKTMLALLLPLPALVWLVGTSVETSTTLFWMILVALASFGFYLPNLVLSRRVSTRKRAIFEDFPDALDLLTVCVEAGLGLDAALMRVAKEIQLGSPVVASELELMLLELRSGFSKATALRNFSLRIGVEDIESFSTLLIQADRFGTGIGASLRVLSDTLRTRRRMRAEEQAAKISLKLLVPLLFCIFPALMVVLAGPAFINIYRTLLPSLPGGGG
ncbi:tight adherence protein C [Paraburkholderia eburnea]|uniref:Tight adherence protein C n=1 Tax=Paraburkholderia eburnea TaxID=1189126 RepID=A0A2S4MAB8_9BURK|nr:type II secretion system F family protein [Paraburkholderia eburnea]POR51688.1 tight adherence protein C [Paraburkholderia eburnea]PRZ22719.1 tight adherence protein C [Paraburkholderia eburnea]